MTPPREPVPNESAATTVGDDAVDNGGVQRDPSVVRASDVIDDLPRTDTAKKMLDKFKSLETQQVTESTAPAGPKPLKRITPPRELATNGSNGNGTTVKESSPERDPNIGECLLRR